ncbi:MAG: hypothetical protein M3Y35_11670, partial [Actinomycetota bacterium]|nr:hypothetical protein [Actinomycetota bacterium]
MTNYCTTIHPIVVLENLRSEMTAASGNPSKRSAVAVRTFRTVGSALTATAKNLQGCRGSESDRGWERPVAFARQSGENRYG